MKCTLERYTPLCINYAQASSSLKQHWRCWGDSLGIQQELILLSEAPRLIPVPQGPLSTTRGNSGGPCTVVVTLVVPSTLSWSSLALLGLRMEPLELVDVVSPGVAPTAFEYHLGVPNNIKTKIKRSRRGLRKRRESGMKRARRESRRGRTRKISSYGGIIPVICHCLCVILSLGQECTEQGQSVSRPTTITEATCFSSPIWVRTN